MSIVAVVIFRLKGGKQSQFEAALDRVLECSSTESGFVRCERYRDVEDPSLYLLYEIWADSGALESHVKTDYFARFMEETDSLLETKQVHVLQPF